jgi:hypothetical protein
MSARPETVKILDTRLNGTPIPLGTIVATSTVAANNATTAAPFNYVEDRGALKGKVLMFQSDVDCYFLSGTTAAATVTAANGVRLNTALERVQITLHPTHGWIAFLGATTTATVKVWELL